MTTRIHLYYKRVPKLFHKLRNLAKRSGRKAGHKHTPG